MGIVAWVVLGLIAGAIAKAIMPGKDPGGIVVTIESGQVFTSHAVQVWRRRADGGWELIAQQSTPKMAETPSS